MKVSLIISTYNWPEALDLVLKSVSRQTELPDEVIIADDGSKETTAQLIKKYQKNFPVPLLHIWHEDEGFRKTIIMNRAFSEVKNDYIVQIDGDVILHPDFIKDHKKLAKQGRFVSGSRVLISPEKTEEMLRDKSLEISFFSKGIKNRMNTLHFPVVNSFISEKREPVEKLIFKIRGCNMAFWRNDVLEINGYDEQFLGWGREDSEFAMRLLKKGLSQKNIKMAAVQYHLYHNENNRDFLESNHKLMMEKLSDKNFFCKNGIRKH